MTQPLTSKDLTSLPGHDLPWLRQIRSLALERFQALGFPTIRDEAWRFTRIEPIQNTVFKPAQQSDAALPVDGLPAFTLPGLQAIQLVFINGHYAPGLSTGDGKAGKAKIGSLAAFLKTNPGDLEKHLARYVDAKTQAFTALNTAFFQDGAHVYLPKGTVLETPIHILYVSTSGAFPTVSHPRTLIVAEQDTNASIIESYVGLNDALYWTNAVTEIVLGENARLDHYKLERESTRAFHISTLQVQQARSSTLNSHAILLGGAIARNNINAVLNDEGAECTLNGLYMTSGSQLVDSHTLIDHAKPHGTSREYYKGILDEKSHGVFDGHIIVRPDAQKTDAIQTNKNLLLSNDALVNTKPELKIFANDVKCKHGATIGQISEEALFYLRSRGIPPAEARRLLIHAFASEIIDHLSIAALREALGDILAAKFHV